MECPNSPSGDHLWCPCFGHCNCNQTRCSMCDTWRAMTAEEIKAKEASFAGIAAGPETEN